MKNLFNYSLFFAIIQTVIVKRDYHMKYQRKKRSSLIKRKAIANPYRKKGFSLTRIKEFFRDLFTTKEGWKKLGICFLIFLGLIIILFGYYAKDLPSPGKINSRISEQSTQIFDRNGKLLYEIHGNENRILVDWGDIPQSVKDATVAIEDKNFYKHRGFDARRILGSTFYNIINRDLVGQGGSTITQQYVKNALLTNEKTYSRKIKEVILAIMIEQMYSKEDILKMYLNEVPYGSNAYGIQTAAKTYFDKDAGKLTLEESALLAAITQAPSYFSPYGQHKDELLKRKDLVLDQMAAQGYITEEQASESKKQEIALSNNQYGKITAPHFVMYVKEKLVEKYGEEMVNEGGLKVFTSLDLEKQNLAEAAVRENVDRNYAAYNDSNASLVAMDPKTGQILAMVGSKDFFDQDIDGNVNVALMGRQPGSSFKPFIYATLFQSDSWGPGSTFWDLKTDFGGGYNPNNYSGRFSGPVSVRYALGNSLNIPAVKALYIAGVKESLNTATAMGISTLTNPEQYGLSLVLGSGEVKLLDMTSAYGVFANKGVKKEATWYVKIEDSKGKVLDEYKETPGKRVLDEQVSYLISNILSDDSARAVTFGTGSKLTLPNRPVAAKTGTTDNYKDAWTLGYTPSLVAGVWAGNNDGTPMTSAGGSIAAAPIWNQFMKNALASSPVEQFARPSGIKNVTVDTITGKKPNTATTSTRTDLFPSWYKIAETDGSSFKIDTMSNKLATDNCPAELVETITQIKITAEIPNTDASYSRWQAPISAWAASQGLATTDYPVPTENCDLHTGKDLPKINITSPSDGDNVEDPITVNLFVDAPKGVKEVVVSVDNKSYLASKMKNGNGYTANIPVSSGSHAIIATVKDTVLQTAQSKTIMIKVKTASPSVTTTTTTTTTLP